MATKAPPIIATRTSQCLCKSIRIEVTGQDKGSVLCHCNNCKQTSGSSFMHNHRFTKSEVKVLEGKNLLKAYKDSDTKSGNTLSRYFCGNCGSSLYLTNSAIKGFVALHCGNLEGMKMRPIMELFPEDKPSWIGNVLEEKARL
ncbi:uncharacterized protein MYCFIDRAFT_31314 [Pseudocercospora fijiensis CIRAD86]|uniref:CENP-V/GFA domain-containing protein n=1 Tax=Pseudocercospora fijiensis (strain CIRAD86) TaxID=383855 RepID=M2ZME3_PSEFD|nr:uncharacterized protein MYCFIDRAFT_31314 [Pseudocercospora fijiensis CIRAD86]EME80239.1 hypothetical protein MYCFIDRAFT_31314 [Pseudocercospora fijiensis CIRAD86]